MKYSTDTEGPFNGLCEQKQLWCKHLRYVPYDCFCVFDPKNPVWKGAFPMAKQSSNFGNPCPLMNEVQP